MSATEIPDAEIVPDQALEALEPQSTQLVRRERRSEVLHPLDSDQLAQSFQEYQDLLLKLLTNSDYQDAGTDRRTGQKKRFVKKSGWRKIATAFDLDVIIVSDEVGRDENGRVTRAKVVARAIAPSGRTMDGDGYCSLDEERFSSSGTQAKIENDLRGTATTRAKNRAISDLVGMGDVSAEEITTTSPELPYGPEQAQAVKKATGQACVTLCGDDKQKGIALWKSIAQELGGYMPQAAAIALIAAASPGNLAPDAEAPEP